MTGKLTVTNCDSTMSPLTIVLAFSVAFGAAFTSACPRECPTYWTAYGDYCYRLYGSLQTWHHAEGRCRRSYPGRTPHLVSIHSSGENAFIKQLLETTHGLGNACYWIGLNELHWPGHYRWSDNSGYTTYLGWRSGEPNNAQGNPEHCVEFCKHVINAGWNDITCSIQMNFICKMPK